MKSYLMLQNARFTVFTVSELLRENQRGLGKNSLSPNQTGVKRKPYGMKKNLR